MGWQMKSAVVIHGEENWTRVAEEREPLSTLHEMNFKWMDGWRDEWKMF